MPDSVLRMTISFENSQRIVYANENYLAAKHAMKKAADKALSNVTNDPVYGNVENINGQQFAYLFYCDTLKRDSISTIYSNLTAHTFLDSTHISFQFSHHAPILI